MINFSDILSVVRLLVNVLVFFGAMLIAWFFIQPRQPILLIKNRGWLYTRLNFLYRYYTEISKRPFVMKVLSGAFFGLALQKILSASLFFYTGLFQVSIVFGVPRGYLYSTLDILEAPTIIILIFTLRGYFIRNGEEGELKNDDNKS